MVSFHIKNMAENIRKFKALKKLTADPDVNNRILEKLKILIPQHVKRLFDTEGSTGKTGKWKELSIPYVVWKARKYPGKTIMKRKLFLYNALMGGKGSQWKIDRTFFGKTRFRFFINSENWKQHQWGTHKLPRRKTFDPTQNELLAFMDTFRIVYRQEILKLKLFKSVNLKPGTYSRIVKVW